VKHLVKAVKARAVSDRVPIVAELELGRSRREALWIDPEARVALSPHFSVSAST